MDRTTDTGERALEHYRDYLHLRRVALKLLPFAAAIDFRQLHRFRNEALAAANLRHENIVTVHAVGCERGVHYYAMQFIEQRRGEPDAQAELRDTTRRVEQILADLAVLHAASKLHLLCQPAVLDDLQLDVGQRAKVKDLTTRAGKQWLDSFKDLGRVSPTRRRQRLLEQARANEAEVNAILSQSQQARLRQIGVHSEGPGAFRDPEIVAALRLTAGQRESIRAIEEQALFAWMRGTPRDPRERSAVKRILELLTEKQCRRWKELVGERPKGLIWPFPPPPGGQKRGGKAPSTDRASGERGASAP